MKPQSMIILLLLLTTSLISCSPGHLGSNEIAFVRDGHLWTIDPDGANAFEIVNQAVPVIGYSWSPNHQLLVFRTLDASFAKTSAGKHLVMNPLTGVPGDLPGDLNTVGIDGGTPIPIIISGSDVQHSNAWWNTSGNRLLYREETTGATTSPDTVLWWVSQNDQPVGIARKLLPRTFSIPSLASSSTTAIGNIEHGIFTTTLAGTNMQYVVHEALPGHPLPATLERVLWQPAHQQPGILYAIAASSSPSPSPSASMVQLVLRDMHGHSTTLATCACTQFAWSPDGNSVLYSTGSTYTVLHIKDNSSFSIPAEDGSVPYWSPDSQFLLLDGLHTLLLAQIASQQQQVLLSDTSTPAGSGTGLPGELGVNALLSPVSNSPWAPDVQHFLFLTRGRSLWQGQHLSSGGGLYSVAIDSHGRVQGMPAIVDTGNDSQAGWSYEDP